MGNNIEDNDLTFEASFLAGLPKGNPFSVPDEYFDELSSSINNAVFIENLKNGVIHSGFTTPEFYFDELNNRIETKIAISKLKETSAHNTGFNVPDAYFNLLEDKILAQTTQIKSETKVIKLWHSSKLKYATAACIILIGTLGLYFNLQYKVKQTAQTAELVNEQMLYDIDENTIIEHVQSKDNTTTGSNTSDNTLESYILNNYSTADLTSEL